MFPDEVTRALARARVPGTCWGVMACLLRYKQPDGTMWRPAEQMAEELGTTPRAIAGAARRLRNAGVLELVSAGHRGRASAYRLARAVSRPKDPGEDAWERLVRTGKPPAQG